MSFRISKNNSLQIIELVYEGIITGEDLKNAASERIAMERNEGLNRSLVDATNIILDASLLSVHNLADIQYEDENLDPNSRIALISPTSKREYEMAEYLASVSRNRGWNMNTFLNRSDAIAWLTDK